MNEREELANIITEWLIVEVSIQDLRAARDGDKSIGRSMAEAILAAGYSNRGAS